MATSPATAGAPATAPLGGEAAVCLTAPDCGDDAAPPPAPGGDGAVGAPPGRGTAAGMPAGAAPPTADAAAALAALIVGAACLAVGAACACAAGALPARGVAVAVAALQCVVSAAALAQRAAARAQARSARRELQRSARLLDSTSDIIAYFDASDRTLHVLNPGGDHGLRGAFDPVPLDRVVCARDLERVVRDSAVPGATVAYDAPQADGARGRPLRFEASVGTALLDEDGDAPGDEAGTRGRRGGAKRLCIIRNVFERTLVEEGRLETAKLETKLEEEAKSQRYQNHEIKNGFISIIHMTDVLLNDARLVADVRARVASMKGSVANLLRMLESRGVVVRLCAGSYAPRLEDVDVEGFVKQKVANILLEGRNVVLAKTTGDCATASLLCLDPHLLGIILDNILSNAFKYGHSNALPTIGLHISRPKLRPDADGRVADGVEAAVSGAPNAVDVTVRLRNHGGPEHQRLLDLGEVELNRIAATPGLRAHASRHVTLSAGDGFPLAKLSAKALRGSLSLALRPTGVVTVLRLSRVAVARPEPAADARHDDLPLRTAAVDDSPLTLRMWDSRLRKAFPCADFRPLLAGATAASIDAFAGDVVRHDVELVLVDQNFGHVHPDKFGTDVVKEIRDLDARDPPPFRRFVYVTSSNDAPEEIARYLALGADGHLSKNATVKTLRRIAADHLMQKPVVYGAETDAAGDADAAAITEVAPAAPPAAVVAAPATVPETEVPSVVDGDGAGDTVTAAPAHGGHEPAEEAAPPPPPPTEAPLPTQASLPNEALLPKEAPPLEEETATVDAASTDCGGGPRANGLDGPTGAPQVAASAATAAARVGAAARGRGKRARAKSAPDTRTLGSPGTPPRHAPGPSAAAAGPLAQNDFVVLELRKTVGLLLESIVRSGYVVYGEAHRLKGELLSIDSEEFSCAMNAALIHDVHAALTAALRPHRDGAGGGGAHELYDARVALAADGNLRWLLQLLYQSIARAADARPIFLDGRASPTEVVLPPSPRPAVAGPDCDPPSPLSAHRGLPRFGGTLTTPASLLAVAQRALAPPGQWSPRGPQGRSMSSTSLDRSSMSLDSHPESELHRMSLDRMSSDSFTREGPYHAAFRPAPAPEAKLSLDFMTRRMSLRTGALLQALGEDGALTFGAACDFKRELATVLQRGVKLRELFDLAESIHNAFTQHLAAHRAHVAAAAAAASPATDADPDAPPAGAAGPPPPSPRAAREVRESLVASHLALGEGSLLREQLFLLQDVLRNVGELHAGRARTDSAASETTGGDSDAASDHSSFSLEAGRLWREGPDEASPAPSCAASPRTVADAPPLLDGFRFRALDFLRAPADFMSAPVEED
ncbi:hypothetical protein M885DRAFT_551810 [Pelagophyceae sp. CCMP2097]|nr:hypothetical protein M885DRAFT_551810 [Pelagophyceae sp. CCMP2097]